MFCFPNFRRLQFNKGFILFYDIINVFQVNTIAIGIGHILIDLCNDQFSCFRRWLCIVNRNPIRADTIFIRFTEL